VLSSGSAIELRLGQNASALGARALLRRICTGGTVWPVALQSSVPTLLRRFRLIAWLEGVSFLLLLGIAMPLKYLAGLPLAVRVVGMAHGVLFVAYVVFVVLFLVRRHWSLARAAEAFGLSLVPFGTFVLDRSLKEELAALSSAASLVDARGEKAGQRVPRT
jgi:integral membrane protein